MDLYPLILESTDLQQAAEINSTRKVKASDVNFPLSSVADFDTQSAFNRWWTTTFKASWIQSTLDGPAIREPNLEIDD
jgi:hypothetical protein